MDGKTICSTVDRGHEEAERPKSTVSEYQSPTSKPPRSGASRPLTTSQQVGSAPPPARVATELRQAGERFCMAVEADDRLALLSLVDPIRAYADAGIFLSRATRRYLRQTHPHLSFGNTKLYEAVRDGKVKLPWIKGIRVSLREEGKDL